MNNKIVTAKDVAILAGVSPATVSRVINNDKRISNETTNSVRYAVNKLGYKVNPLARGLKTNQSMTVGLIAPELANEFYMNIAKGVERYLRPHGYTLLVCNTAEDNLIEQDRIKHLRERRVDGVIIIPTTGNGEAYKSLYHKKIPVVLVDRKVSNYSGDIVLANNLSGAFNVVSKLIEDGYQKIAFIGGNADVSTASERHQGYLKALKQHNIKRDKQLEVFGKFNVQGGYDAMQKIWQRNALQTKFDAIFIVNYFMHIGATKFLNTQLNMSKAPVIASFDDMDLSPLLSFASYTVAQPMLQMGAEAAKLLLDRINNRNSRQNKTVILPTEIVAYRR